MRDFDKIGNCDIERENLYGITLVTLVRDMRRGIARQRIEECMMALLEMGYSRQELMKEVEAFLRDE